jgi:2-dehydro-3-deoxyphosphogluconate aldolase/(4S)-4-hydroxy-2-oxoglutarate aldolase
MSAEGITEGKHPARVAIEEVGLVPLISSTNSDDLFRAAESIVEVGLTVMEVTLRAPGALEALGRLIAHADRMRLPLSVGAGTVLDAATARAAIGIGAQFVFSPVLGIEVGEACLGSGVAWFPGCATPTEILTALDLGCDAVKLFPADAIGGPGFLRSVRSVFPALAAIPSGGIGPSPGELVAWYRAGAIAVGMGSSLFPADAIAASDWEEVARRLGSAVSAVQEAREELRE